MKMPTDHEWYAKKAAEEADADPTTGAPDIYIPGFVPSTADRHYDRQLRALYSLKNSAEEENARLRTAMQEACDLLAERIHGNAARSPGHNARVVLEWAMKQGENPAPQTNLRGDDWFSQVVDFLVKHGMLDERDEYDISDVMAALADNYEPAPQTSGRTK